MLNKRRVCLRTIIVIFAILVGFIGLHMYNHLRIQSISYTGEWGRGVEIGSAGINHNPLIEGFEDNILTITFDKKGQVNYSLVKSDGTLVKNGIAQIDGFNKNKIKDVYLIRNNLYYVKDSKLYKVSFNENSMFSTPETLVGNIEGFNYEVIDDVVYIQAYNKDKIQLYSIDNNKLKLEETFKNIWNIKDIYLRELNGQRYMFIVNKVNELSDEVLGGNLIDFKENNLKKVDKLEYLVNTYIGEIDIIPNEDKFFMVYPVMKILPGGQRSVTIEVKSMDAKKLNVVDATFISDTNIADLNDRIDVLLYNDGIRLFGSGLNTDNKYALKADIFMIDIDSSCNIKSTTYLSSTEHYSKNPTILDNDKGSYLAWLEIKDSGYRLMLNSTNEDFKRSSYTYTQQDYKNAFLKALVTPFYAIALTAIKGTVVLIFSILVFIPAVFIIKKMDIKDDKKKFFIFLGVYIIYNLFTFKNMYYRGTGVEFIPDILKSNFMIYIVPIALNILSAIVLFAYYRDKKYFNYLKYLVLFIGADIYFINLLYAPFSMMKIILGEL
ncbi:hypothetical protein [Caldisalinibacter kiritimatiensis]|uniref:Uncharacterized protein n=1 Tax=Caldisalinibacter kiritimatiensis TaxID=1304284 RepID=R1ASD9_9FIRM|nr:hypothetical protein [Caldisalinibacter kiritimatiensis]EOC99566.1 hypothetical protein L21TH_2401 [Caldisalinibacter kiritimatiensis]